MNYVKSLKSSEELADILNKLLGALYRVTIYAFLSTNWRLVMAPLVVTAMHFLVMEPMLTFWVVMLWLPAEFAIYANNVRNIEKPKQAALTRLVFLSCKDNDCFIVRSVETNFYSYGPIACIRMTLKLTQEEYKKFF